MERNNYTLITLLMVLTLMLVAATETNAQRYSGRATAVRTTVGVPLISPVTTAVNDTGELPAAGGSITLASAGASIGTPPFLTAGASSSMTSGGANASHSETSVSNLNFSVLGNTIMATTVATRTDCSCPTGSCTGSTTIVGLTLNGSTVTVTGAVNQTIILTAGPLGPVVGTLVINEQISGPGSITVNGLHVNVTDSATGITTDVVVASSHSDIICTILPNFTFFSGRAFSIGTTATTQDLILGTSSVAVLVADTGDLPTSGGSIGPVVVAGANIPGVATSGTLTSSTSGGIVNVLNASDSSSSVQNLNATVAGFTITGSLLTSVTHCECSLSSPTTDSTCTGSSTIANLLIAAPFGGSVNGAVTGAANETVTLEVGGMVVATLIFNEQTPTPLPTNAGTVTVNALRIMTATSVPGVSTTQTNTIIASSHSDIECGLLTTTAASVNVSGRVVNADNRSVPRARVTLSSATGETYVAMTSSFGYFSVTEVPAGQTYIVNIVARGGYTFEPQTLTVNDELTDLTFVLEQTEGYGGKGLQLFGSRGLK